MKKAKLAALRALSFKGFRSQLSWMSQAQELYSSSRVLWKKSIQMRRIESNPFTGMLSKLFEVRFDVYQRVSYLLIGLAIENLAKGIVIGRTAPDEQGAVLAQLSKNHDIRTVLSKIDKRDRPAFSGPILEKLEAHVVWASKYPVPKSPNDYKGDLVPSDFNEIEKLYFDLLEIGFKDSADEIAATLNE